MKKSKSKIFFYISMLGAIVLAFMVIAIIIRPVLISNLIFVSILLILLIIDILIFYFNEPDFPELHVDLIWSNEGAKQQSVFIKKLQGICLKIDKFFKNLIKK